MGCLSLPGERVEIRGRVVVRAEDLEICFVRHGHSGGDSAGGAAQQPGRGLGFGSPVLALPRRGGGELVDDLVEERGDSVQQGVEDGAELGRSLGRVQSRAVGAQVWGGERLRRQGVARAEVFGIACGPAVQVVPCGGPGMVGVDLFGGAADVVIQLEVGVLQCILLSFGEDVFSQTWVRWYWRACRDTGRKMPSYITLLASRGGSGDSLRG